MADVDTLLDFDSPALTATHQSSDDVNCVSLMDPFATNYDDVGLNA